MFVRIDEPPLWNDRPVAIVGGGPSLQGFDFEQLKPFHVLAVKGMMFDLPWATAGFGLDCPRYVSWMHKFSSIDMPVYWAHDKAWVGSFYDDKPSNVSFVERRQGTERASDDPSFVYAGGSSGFGALQFAYLKRAKKIGLFGFDYKPQGDVWHFNENNYEKRRRQSFSVWRVWAMYYVRFISLFETAGVECVNGSPNSEIIAFPRMTPDDAAECLYRF